MKSRIDQPESRNSESAGVIVASAEPELLASLRWYLDHENHGRGKLTRKTAMLARNGYIAITQTGRYDWTAAITAKGRLALGVPA